METILTLGFYHFSDSVFFRSVCVCVCVSVFPYGQKKRDAHFQNGKKKKKFHM